MDLRVADENTQAREAMMRTLLGVCTSIPGIIDSFNPATQTCTVVPGIMMQTNIDGVIAQVELPPIVEAPLIVMNFPTAGFAITGPVKKGDPCLILFAQRAIDNWLARGPKAQPSEDGIGCRHHSLTDALVLMAPIPLPMVISNYNESGIEIRSTNPANHIIIGLDNEKICIEHTTSKFTVTAAGVEVDAPVTFKKAVTLQSTITTSLGIELTNHKHTSAAIGSPTGVPIA